MPKTSRVQNTNIPTTKKLSTIHLPLCGNDLHVSEARCANEIKTTSKELIVALELPRKPLSLERENTYETSMNKIIFTGMANPTFLTDI
jgi:hypothetical protein